MENHIGNWKGTTWNQGHPGVSDRLYGDEERDFLLAVGRYQMKHRKRFLTCCDFLVILKSLGYAKHEAEP